MSAWFVKRGYLYGRSLLYFCGCIVGYLISCLMGYLIGCITGPGLFLGIYACCS
jgi:mannitol-specific phosphotransferase system IIBC component